MSTVAIQYDPLDPSTIDDPYPILAHLREAEPVQWHEAMHSWVLTRYEDCVAVWQGTRHPPDIPRLEAQLHAYVAAGGTTLVHEPRGDTAAAMWALGWHRLWSAGWFLRQVATPADDRQDRVVEAILRCQITAAATLLRNG